MATASADVVGWVAHRDGLRGVGAAGEEGLMAIQVKIKEEIIEWVSDQTGMDREEAQEFVKHFVGMLYFTGAFEAIEITPGSSANANVKAPAERD